MRNIFGVGLINSVPVLLLKIILQIKRKMLAQRLKKPLSAMLHTISVHSRIFFLGGIDDTAVVG